MDKNLDDLARQDGRYSPLAVRFVYEGLNHTTKQAKSDPKHVSGQALCEGLKELALQRWGRLANLVLNSAGAHTTRDFGEIVYLLIKHNWMSAQPSDAIEDFDGVYDFHTAFKDQFKF